MSWDPPRRRAHRRRRGTRAACRRAHARVRSRRGLRPAAASGSSQACRPRTSPRRWRRPPPRRCPHRAARQWFSSDDLLVESRARVERTRDPRNPARRRFFNLHPLGFRPSRSRRRCLLRAERQRLSANDPLVGSLRRARVARITRCRQTLSRCDSSIFVPRYPQQFAIFLDGSRPVPVEGTGLDGATSEDFREGLHVRPSARRPPDQWLELKRPTKRLPPSRREGSVFRACHLTHRPRVWPVMALVAIAFVVRPADIAVAGLAAPPLAFEDRNNSGVFDGPDVDITRVLISEGAFHTDQGVVIRGGPLKLTDPKTKPGAPAGISI